MSEINAKEYLKKFNMESRIIHTDKSSATVTLAAEAFNTKPERICKSLAFRLKDRVIMILMSGTYKIDNAKFRAEFSEKANMLAFEDVDPIVGHPVGGVCPFGINTGIDVYLDESLKQFDTVFPACGEHNNAIELTIKELELTSNFVKWIDVTRKAEN